MKHVFTLALLLSSLSLFSQSQKQDTTREQSTTRAVVIGVSNYENDDIDDLEYAHKDAEAFANWLRFSLGDTLLYDNIKVYTDSAATNAQIDLSIGWLIEESNPGDKVFIYLSGHGDVETVTKRRQKGYFLPWDSPAVLYRTGAFAMRDLQDFVDDLTDNEVQVILIVDACRAGVLAGSSVKGTEVTATRLTTGFNNTTKILSCEPKELSLESEQWGGGRGAFSYNLENALFGFADKDEGGTITIKELQRYLQDAVSEQVDPRSQNPIVKGSASSAVVALVNDTLYEQKKEELEGIRPRLLAINPKGSEEKRLAILDSTMLPVYEQFLAAIDANTLMHPNKTSANNYYKILIANNAIESMHGSFKRKFAVALLDEGQDIMNKIIETDPQLIDRIWAGKIKYDHLPEYFNRAIEILGKDHHLYPILKAKQLYFESKTYREENYPGKKLSWRLNKQKALLKEAIGYDSLSAILYYDLGNKYPFNPNEASPNYEKAIALSPNWIWGQYALGAHYHSLGQKHKNLGLLDKATHHLSKVIQLDSNFIIAYNAISFPYEDLGNSKSAQFYKRQYVDKFIKKMETRPAEVTAYECSEVGRTLHEFKRYPEAKEYLLYGDSLSKGGMLAIYRTLSVVYTDMQEFENATVANEKLKSFNYPHEFCDGFNGAIYFNFLYNNSKAGNLFSKLKYNKITDDEIQGFKVEYYYQTNQYLETIKLADKCLHKLSNPYSFVSRNPHFFHFYKAESYSKQNKTAKAKAQYQFIIDNTDASFSSNNHVVRPDYLYKALAYHRLGKQEELEQLITSAEIKLKGDSWLYYDLARIYAMSDQKEKAIANLYKAIDFGWQPNAIGWIHGTLCDHFLNPIRESDAYKELVNKHFPEYYDIATRIPK